MAIRLNISYDELCRLTTMDHDNNSFKLQIYVVPIKWLKLTQKKKNMYLNNQDGKY